MQMITLQSSCDTMVALITRTYDQFPDNPLFALVVPVIGTSAAGVMKLVDAAAWGQSLGRGADGVIDPFRAPSSFKAAVNVLYPSSLYYLLVVRELKPMDTRVLALRGFLALLWAAQTILDRFSTEANALPGGMLFWARPVAQQLIQLARMLRVPAAGVQPAKIVAKTPAEKPSRKALDDSVADTPKTR
eukprot:gnl/Ergobibamus_cyprinoides/1751.p1 GENE.gnl/Ergobibamus_cyprinoides/1751~~gnl/Ergobibamus_cyprinoides/1751.p1  ORF type:complete len:189 (+),score=7.72 gnl/Ergobibamus_cyprinoides/1751:411-977(+)